MLSIGLAYFVTLCLFPGIESEVVSCRLGTWMPVIMMAAFNTSDVIGKVSRDRKNLAEYIIQMYVDMTYTTSKWIFHSRPKRAAEKEAFYLVFDWLSKS